jgi:eukaryotic-like serine/threonine-protein kinase
MTLARRSRMDELFDAALRLGPAEREAWLQRACGSDDKLRAEVGRLLSQNERVERDGEPDAQGRTSEETGSWPCPSSGHRPRGPEPIGHAGAGPVADPSGFSPSAASVAGSQPHLTSEAELPQARQLGPYRLREPIGAGAMGEVDLAEHQFLKRPCALKLIRPDRMVDPQALERFEREVRVTATLSHPNTVEIYDYGRTSDGTYYYVMEYLPGLTLAELVQQHGPLPPGRVVYLLRQVCQALREAHAVGLIHRDLKPSNIIAARRGGMDDVAKLLDFGLVLPATPAQGANLSAEGQIVGTPLFMSPEQATGDRELDQRSDIYSLGAVGYYLLTGRPPFNGASGMAVLVAHARDPVVPPSLIRTGTPENLERVVLRCLAKDAADRFSDAESLERTLGECTCSGDWDPDRAARWWRDEGRISMPHTAASAL